MTQSEDAFLVHERFYYSCPQASCVASTLCVCVCAVCDSCASIWASEQVPADKCCADCCTTEAHQFVPHQGVLCVVLTVITGKQAPLS